MNDSRYCRSARLKHWSLAVAIAGGLLGVSCSRVDDRLSAGLSVAPDRAEGAAAPSEAGRRGRRARGRGARRDGACSRGDPALAGDGFRRGRS